MQLLPPPAVPAKWGNRYIRRNNKMKTESEWMDFIRKRREQEKAKFKRQHENAVKRRVREKEGYVPNHGDFYREKPNQIKTDYDKTVLLAFEFRGRKYRFGHPQNMVNDVTILTHKPSKKKYIMSTAKIYQYIDSKQYEQIFHADYNIGFGKKADTTVYQCDLEDLTTKCKWDVGENNAL